MSRYILFILCALLATADRAQEVTDTVEGRWFETDSASEDGFNPNKDVHVSPSNW